MNDVKNNEPRYTFNTNINGVFKQAFRLPRLSTGTSRGSASRLPR